jgi:hypothetical protein
MAMKSRRCQIAWHGLLNCSQFSGQLEILDPCSTTQCDRKGMQLNQKPLSLHVTGKRFVAPKRVLQTAAAQSIS